MTLNEKDPEKRLSMASQVMPSGYDGRKIDQRWIDFGFAVLHGAGPRESSSARRYFEDRLLGLVAVEDFRRAMSYIDAVSTSLDRLQMLIAVAEALDHKSAFR